MAKNNSQLISIIYRVATMRTIQESHRRMMISLKCWPDRRASEWMIKDARWRHREAALIRIGNLWCNKITSWVARIANNCWKWLLTSNRREWMNKDVNCCLVSRGLTRAPCHQSLMSPGTNHRLMSLSSICWCVAKARDTRSNGQNCQKLTSFWTSRPMKRALCLQETNRIPEAHYPMKTSSLSSWEFKEDEWKIKEPPYHSISLNRKATNRNSWKNFPHSNFKQTKQKSYEISC